KKGTSSASAGLQMLDHQAVLRVAPGLQRLQSARCINSDCRKELRQGRGRAAVEAEPRALRQPGDFLERRFGDRIVPFLESKYGNAVQPEPAGLVGEVVDILLHRVADVDKRVDLGPLRLLQRV